LGSRRFDTAIALHRQGKLDQAATAYAEIARDEPQNIEAWRHLVMALHQAKLLERAQQVVSDALQHHPDAAALHLMAGNVYQDVGNLVQAISSFRRAVELDRGNAQSHNNLGLALLDGGDADGAKNAFEAAVELSPNYARGLNNLAGIHFDRREFERSMELYGRGVAADHSNTGAHLGLARSQLELGRFAVAQRTVEALLSSQSNTPDAWLLLGFIHRDQKHSDHAIWCFQQGLTRSPNHVQLLLALAKEASTAGNLALADSVRVRLGAAGVSDLKSDIDAALTLPQVFESVQAIHKARHRYAVALAQLKSDQALASQPVESVVRALTRNNFYLAYHGENDLPLQMQFADWQASVLKQHLPEFYQSIAKAPRRSRVRVGFVSGFMHTSTAGLYFEHWIRQLPLDEFEVFVWEVDGSRHNPDDELRRRVQSYVDSRTNEPKHYIQLPSDLVALATSVKGANLDVLIYPELGMRADVYTLGSMRLAPLQCMAWGHPVTSGHENIDVAFSSELMEPVFETARAHYRERLVLLPGIGTQYQHGGLPATPKPRAAYQLPEGEAVLALYPQSLFKIRPENDQLVVELLRRHPKLVLVMFQGQTQALTSAFVTRMSKAFAQAGLAPAGRIKMLPAMSHDDYLSVCLNCDFMLDTLFWSGGNTSLDAIACGLPIVTLAGEFMRSRQSAAMLRLMELEELVAASEASYLDIASKIIDDPVWRDELRGRMVANRQNVFDDPSPILALIEWLRANARQS
jgi:protein O-GlcNAc transferase